MPDPVTRSGTIEGLQILRAVAALMVVFHHARYSVPGGADWPAFGEAGVDIFFVISGFVMAHTTRHLPGDSSAAQRFAACREFVMKRVIRVVPLYWLVLLWTSRRELGQGHVGGDLLKDFAFLPHPNAAYPDRLWPTVLQGWTLNYEMLFYALFAIALLFGGRRLVAVAVALVGLVAVGAVAGSIVALDGTDWRGIALRFYTDDILLEFGFGVVLQRLWARGVLPCGSRAPSVGLLAGGFVFLVLGHGHAPRSVCQGLPALLIVWGSLGAFAGARLPTWERLGAASYAIYLVHWASFGAVKPVAGWLGTVTAGRLLLLGLLCLVAIVAGLALHAFVERPFLDWAHGRFGAARVPRVAPAE